MGSECAKISFNGKIFRKNCFPLEEMSPHEIVRFPALHASRGIAARISTINLFERTSMPTIRNAKRTRLIGPERVRFNQAGRQKAYRDRQSASNPQKEAGVAVDRAS